MARTSAKAKKSKQDVNKKKEEAKQQENQTDSEGAGESTDKENDSTNYDVEKITHTRIFKGKRQYLVRWKGYTEDSDTWENESVLQSCKEILEAFKKDHLTEANSDDEDEEEEAEEKKKPKGKKVAKNVKKNTKKSGKSSKQKVENEDSDIGTEEEIEEEETIEVKGKNKDKSFKEPEESDEDIKEKTKKEEPKGKKRKSAKGTESSKAKKAKKVENDDDEDDESVTDGKDYEVEKILEVHTRRDGSHEFLIRWKGYRPSDDTWEPEAHLDCKELIEKFMGKVDKAKEFSKKELRERADTKRFVPVSSRRQIQRNRGFRPCYQETPYED